VPNLYSQVHPKKIGEQIEELSSSTCPKGAQNGKK